MATAKLTQLLVLIDRDATTKLPATIFDYELPILEDLYGEEQVFVVEDETKEVEVENFDLSAAFDGLVAKYKRTAEGDTARRRYFSKARDLEKKLGSAISAKSTSKPASDDDSVDKPKTVAEITAALGGMSDAEIDALETAELEGKDRQGVHAAIEAERAKRTAQ